MVKTRRFQQIVGEVIRHCLAQGNVVDVDGLGVFQKTQDGVRYEPAVLPRVFIAYVAEDFSAAERIYSALALAGFNPWLDRKKLLPGQNWRRCIERAIDTSDFFIPVFSSTSVRKRGQFPYEIRYALQCAEQIPLDDCFIMPVKIDACKVPDSIAQTVQCVELFPDWQNGIDQLTGSIRAEWTRRALVPR